MTQHASTQARPALGVSIAVFREGRVLVATRTKPPFVGAYSLPGGHVEAGETLEQAALRELYEEVGVTARIIGFNQHVETIRWENASQLSRQYVIASFVGAWVSGEGRPSPEVGEILWIAPQELAKLPTTPALSTIVEDASRIFAQRACA
jgi:8-oxo-dGTP diphosphatase